MCTFWVFKIIIIVVFNYPLIELNGQPRVNEAMILHLSYKLRQLQSIKNDLRKYDQVPVNVKSNSISSVVYRAQKPFRSNYANEGVDILFPLKQLVVASHKSSSTRTWGKVASLLVYINYIIDIFLWHY